MSGTTRTAAIRLATDDLDLARRKFEALGSVGDQVLDRISQAGQRAFSDAARQHVGLTTSAGQASHAMRQLGIQSIDVFQQLASGAPIMTTLIQQGGQVGQMAAVTGTSLGAMAKAAAGAALGINPLILAGVAVTAAVVAIGVAAESSARQVQDLGVRLRASRDDYDAVSRDIVAASKAIAASTSFTGADARAAGLAIGNSSGFRGAAGEMEELIRTAGDLAVVTGKSLPEAAGDLAQALADPAAAAKRLADQSFPGMSQSMAYSIKLMADAGDQAGAQARQLEVLRNGIRGASDAATPLQKAVRDLGNAFTATGQDGRSLADALGSAITSAAATAVNAVTGVVKGIESLRQAAVQPPAAIPAAGGYTGTFGKVLTSDAGARGIFQLMPDTAAGLRVNADDANQNILGGLTYIQQLLGRHRGNVDAALRDYGGFVRNDPSAYIAQVQGADVGVLNSRNVLSGSQTMSVTQAIEYWGQILGLTPDVIALGKRIAVVESGGRQFVAAGIGPTSTPLPSGPSVRSAEDAGMARYAADAQRLRDQAFQAWLGSGTLSARQEQNRAEQDLFRSAMRVTTDPDEIRRYTEALAKLRAEESDLITEQQKLARSAVDASRALSEQDGWTRRMAEIEAQFATAARASGEAIDEKSLAMAKAAEQAKLSREFEDQVVAANRATEAQERIAAAYDGSALSIERATNRERALAEARLRFNPQSAEFAGNVDRLADAFDRSTAASRVFQNQQSSVTALFDTLATAADRVGSSLVQIFLEGSTAALNFGSVARAALASVSTELFKQGAINPLINIFASDPRPTLWAALGAAGAASGGSGGGNGGNAGGGTSLLGSIGNALSLGRISDALGLTNLGAQLSGAGEWLGLTGSNGLFSGIGNGISSLLGTTLWEGPAGSLALLGGAEYGNAALAAAGTPVTIGQLLGGFGLGFGAGSFGGGLLQSALGRTGPAPTIGAGLGAGAGAVIGSFTPLGPVLGGLLGGLLGGGGGAFIGPGKKNAFSATGVTLGDDGLLAVGKTFSQIVDTSQEVARLNQQVAAINQFMSANKLKITNTTSQDEFGQTRINGANSNVWMNIGQSSGASSDLFSAFNELRFSAANDDRLNGLVSGRSFSGPDQLADFTTFVNSTMTALEKAPVSEYTTSLKALNDVYDAAIAKAKEYTVAEGGLVAERDRRLADINARRDLQASGITAGLDVRYLQATGKNEEAAILAFDTAAAQQRMQLTDQILTLGLDGTEYAAARLVQIEKTLAAERIAIQEQYADQSRQVATSILGGLAYGGLSPLAPEQKYFASLTALNQARQALDEGGSVAEFASIAQQVLPVARDFLGTSERYAALVADVASAVASNGGDPAGLSGLLQAQVEGTDALKDVLSRYGEQQYSVANATLSEIKRLASAIEALMARSVAA